MPRQNSLFPETSADSTSPFKPASTSLVIAGKLLGPEQKLFNQLLAKISKHQQNLLSLQTMLEAHRLVCIEKMEPLERQSRLLHKQMAVYLDERLQQPKGLTKGLRTALGDMVYGLVTDLVGMPEEDAHVRVLLQRYAPADEADWAESLNAALEGKSPKQPASGPGADEFVNAADSEESAADAWQRIQQEIDQQEESREAARKLRRKKSAKQQQVEEELLDAGKALQSIYRKLASALHPDRELDALERVRKTALMVQVNGAYERSDLLALLQLQLQVEQVDSRAVAGMADEKLRAFNRALKAQAQSLQNEVLQLEARMRQAFGIAYGPVTPASLDMALRYQASQTNELIVHMQSEIRLVQDDRELKIWIKNQQAMARDDFDMSGEVEALLEAMLHSTTSQARRKGTRKS